MPEAFRDHLGEALATVQRDVPTLAAELARAVGDRVIEIQVDGTPFWVGVGPLGVELRGHDDGCVAWGTASGEAIDALLNGEKTLEEAVFDGSVQLRGALNDLVALDQGLRVFVQCAVRAPGILPILASWNARKKEAT